MVEAEVFACHLEDLPLRLDQACASHLFVFSHDPYDLRLVLFDRRGELRRESGCRIRFQSVLSHTRLQGQLRLCHGEQHVSDAQNSASPSSLTVMSASLLTSLTALTDPSLLLRLAVSGLAGLVVSE